MGRGCNVSEMVCPFHMPPALVSWLFGAEDNNLSAARP